MILANLIQHGGFYRINLSPLIFSASLLTPPQPNGRTWAGASAQCGLHTPDPTRKPSSFTENMAEITRWQRRCSKAEGNWVKKGVLEALRCHYTLTWWNKTWKRRWGSGNDKNNKATRRCWASQRQSICLKMTISHRSLCSSGGVARWGAAWRGGARPGSYTPRGHHTRCRAAPALRFFFYLLRRNH